ncbi:mor transcription activator family protein [Pasteurella multocida]|uniref:Mor transcription activator family protein n=1 Tax=Pasteurella multocida TaxID=747 RepID=UPI00292F76AC|nr:Mor transcription activator family protein [Pasteurella multocida]WNY73955.1 mor transcription activator family protein [Pasteurella multocida]HDR1912010.1 mor transcription activator family protein [Pasteurella multocida]HDR1913188.1 mor transcription activator family protein [Pasteurella multocida]
MSEFREVSEYLPDVVHRIIDITSFPAAEKIIKRLGGTTFKFKKTPFYFDLLKDLIGEEDAEKLRQYFLGCEVYIPRCEVALRVLRNRRFKADFDYLTQEEKKSARKAIFELCPKYQISDRQGWEIVSSAIATNSLHHSQDVLF